MDDVYYVDGTPVTATLYGLDIWVPQQWKQAPDLVISGPNEGQNTGPFINASGTASNARFAAARGLPSMAVSADFNTADNETLARDVAGLTVKLVAALAAEAGKGPLLPAGNNRRGQIAVRVMQVGFDAGPQRPQWLQEQMASRFEQP